MIKNIHIIKSNREYAHINRNYIQPSQLSDNSPTMSAQQNLAFARLPQADRAPQNAEDSHPSFAQRLAEEEIEINERYQQEAKYARLGRQAPKMHRKAKYYRNSYHVFMEYLGGRIYLADVYEKRKAESLLLRLQGVDQLMATEEKNISPHSGEERREGSQEQGSPFGIRPSLDDK